MQRMDRIHVVARPSTLRFHSHATGFSFSDLWASSPPAQVGTATSEGIGKVSDATSEGVGKVSGAISTMFEVIAAVAIVGVGVYAFKSLKK